MIKGESILSKYAIITQITPLKFCWEKYYKYINSCKIKKKEKEKYKKRQRKEKEKENKTPVCQKYLKHTSRSTNIHTSRSRSRSTNTNTSQLVVVQLLPEIAGGRPVPFETLCTQGSAHSDPLNSTIVVWVWEWECVYLSQFSIELNEHHMPQSFSQSIQRISCLSLYLLYFCSSD